jgi:hypothetical protein
VTSPGLSLADRQVGALLRPRTEASSFEWDRCPNEAAGFDQPPAEWSRWNGWHPDYEPSSIPKSHPETDYGEAGPLTMQNTSHSLEQRP